MCLVGLFFLVYLTTLLLVLIFFFHIPTCAWIFQIVLHYPSTQFLTENHFCFARIVNHLLLHVICVHTFFLYERTLSNLKWKKNIKANECCLFLLIKGHGFKPQQIFFIKNKMMIGAKTEK